MIDEPAPEFASTTAVVLGSAVPRKVGLKKYREKWLLLFFCSLPASDEDCDVEAVVTRRVELERKYGCRVLGVASGFTVEDITMWVRRRNNGKNSNGKLQHFRSLGAADVCIISDPDYAIARRYGIPLVASPAVSSGGSGGGGDGVGERTAGARELAQAMFLLSPDGLVKYRSLIGTAERNIEEHMMLLQTYFFTDLGPASASSTSVHHHQQQQQLSDGVPQRTMGDVRNYVYSMRSSANSEAEDVDPPGGSGATAELDGDLKVGAALLSAGSWYQRQLRVRPLVTKAVTSCAVGLLGEIIGASINRYYAVRRSGGISGEGAAGFCKSKFISVHY